uniref:NADH-ubiquinone oxidoreductase chain 2 n=1 Tax=Parastacus brasiliensis TaxID=108041 RepID=A0A411ATR5_9EUCA|nr:NADH dehydrogenase subunit 2 [Parastacus brasiliensis]
MLFSSYKLLFLLSLVLGSILSISATSWFSAWAGLELNLLSFIPLISSYNNRLSSEAALKYFLIQALGSAMIIFSSTFISLFAYLPYLFISLSLLLKLGAAPFHFWFPQVMEGLGWIQAMILMTVQKLAPMFLISYSILCPFSSGPVFLAALISALVGAIGGMNQSSLRKLLSFSSINHMSWMLLAVLINETLWVSYFIFYSLLTFSVVLIFHALQLYHISNVMGGTQTLLSRMIPVLSLFSLGGLPPFVGFLPKWIVIQELINSSFVFSLLILLVSSLFTLYFYLRLSLTVLSISPSQNKWSLSNPPLYFILSAFFSFFNLFGLLLPSVVMII